MKIDLPKYEMTKVLNDGTFKYKNLVLPFISSKKFKQLHKSHPEYRICGKLTEDPAKKKNIFTLEYENFSFPICSINEKTGFLKRVVGYIQISENEFIAVYKLNIPVLLGTIAVLLEIIALLFVMILNIQKIPNNNDDPNGKGLKLDENQGKLEEKKNEITHSKNIILPGWTEITIPKNTVEISQGIDFYNPEGNDWFTCTKCGSLLDEDYKCTNLDCSTQFNVENAQKDCYYLTFALYLEQNNELLFQSDLIKPGMHLQKIKISKAFAEGEYDAYIMIQPYKSDMATPCNNAKIKLKLYVK